jgi:GNAT superfamily N-acetyltransferase
MSPVTVYYLEMRDPRHLRSSPCVQGNPLIMECQIKQYPLNRFLYEWVGKQWRWTDKLNWSDAQWREYAQAPELRTFVAYDQGAIAGYYELQRQGDEVQIAYFGLTEQFIGKGYGAYLLTEATRHAWEWGASRVWVHTCTLDHPAALANYRARGFQVYRVEQVTAA